MFLILPYIAFYVRMQESGPPVDDLVHRIRYVRLGYEAFDLSY